RPPTRVECARLHGTTGLRATACSARLDPEADARRAHGAVHRVRGELVPGLLATMCRVLARVQPVLRRHAAGPHLGGAVVRAVVQLCVHDLCGVARDRAPDDSRGVPMAAASLESWCQYYVCCSSS
ncbi:unnamed protein product, partial [Prorocentrum cordatum]